MVQMGSSRNSNLPNLTVTSFHFIQLDKINGIHSLQIQAFSTFRQAYLLNLEHDNISKNNLYLLANACENIRCKRTSDPNQFLPPFRKGKNKWRIYHRERFNTCRMFTLPSPATLAMSMKSSGQA